MAEPVAPTLEGGTETPPPGAPELPAENAGQVAPADQVTPVAPAVPVAAAPPVAKTAASAPVALAEAALAQAALNTPAAASSAPAAQAAPAATAAHAGQAGQARPGVIPAGDDSQTHTTRQPQNDVRREDVRATSPIQVTAPAATDPSPVLSDPA